MQAAFQWRFPGLFLHIFLYTFFYFHAASDPAHLLSQHFGCYCCPAFSLATPFVFPFFSYLTLLTCSSSITTLRLPLLPDYLSTFSISLFSLLSYLWRPFHSFPFSHIYDVFLLLIFYLNFRVDYYVQYRFPLFIFFSQLFTCSSFIPTIDLVILSPLSPWYHPYRSCLQPARFLYQLSCWWLLLFQFYRMADSKDRLYSITVNKKVNKNLPWVVEKQCFALACGVLAVGMVEKRCKKGANWAWKKNEWW